MINDLSDCSWPYRRPNKETPNLWYVYGNIGPFGDEIFILHNLSSEWKIYYFMDQNVFRVHQTWKDLENVKITFLHVYKITGITWCSLCFMGHTPYPIPRYGLLCIAACMVIVVGEWRGEGRCFYGTIQTRKRKHIILCNCRGRYKDSRNIYGHTFTPLCAPQRKTSQHNVGFRMPWMWMGNGDGCRTSGSQRDTCLYKWM